MVGCGMMIFLDLWAGFSIWRTLKNWECYNAQRVVLQKNSLAWTIVEIEASFDFVEVRSLATNVKHCVPLRRYFYYKYHS